MMGTCYNANYYVQAAGEKDSLKGMLKTVTSKIVIDRAIEGTCVWQVPNKAEEKIAIMRAFSNNNI